MKNLHIDFGYLSLNKKGEQLCGDRVETVLKDDNTFIMVLADGLGSGVKANILSTLTSKIISTMIAQDMSVDECVSTIVETLPVCEKRKVAYSTFTIIKIDSQFNAEIIQYDNPHVILLRNGVNYDYEKNSRIIDNKEIFESKIKLQKNDVFVAMSDGCIYAGVGKTLNFGWQRENIIKFAEAFYDEKMSAKNISTNIIDECNRLYDFQPGDDTTVSAIKIREKKIVNLLMGPPVNDEELPQMFSSFLGNQGKRIVCGGTTSNLMAKFLNEKVETILDYVDPEIPPVGKIKGIDVVTEGVITMSRVLEYALSYIADNECYDKWSAKEDGASIISRLLFEEATNINFFVGRAMNPAHQNPKLPIGYSIKMRLVEDLKEALKAMGKTVTVKYY